MSLLHAHLLPRAAHHCQGSSASGGGLGLLNAAFSAPTSTIQDLLHSGKRKYLCICITKQCFYLPYLANWFTWELAFFNHWRKITFHIWSSFVWFRIHLTRMRTISLIISWSNNKSGIFSFFLIYSSWRGRLLPRRSWVSGTRWKLMSFHADTVLQLPSKWKRATRYGGKMQRAEFSNHL